MNANDIKNKVYELRADGYTLDEIADIMCDLVINDEKQKGCSCEDYPCCGH